VWAAIKRAPEEEVDMDAKQIIENAVAAQGWTVKSWDEEHENGLSAVVGDFKVVEPDDSNGLYLHDEGSLMACVVGSAERHNQRVSWWLHREDYGDSDVEDLSLLDPIA
jgi:hypothetical protein